MFPHTCPAPLTSLTCHPSNYACSAQVEQVVAVVGEYYRKLFENSQDGTQKNKYLSAFMPNMSSMTRFITAPLAGSLPSALTSTTTPIPSSGRNKTIVLAPVLLLFIISGQSVILNEMKRTWEPSVMNDCLEIMSSLDTQKTMKLSLHHGLQEIIDPNPYRTR